MNRLVGTDAPEKTTLEWFLGALLGFDAEAVAALRARLEGTQVLIAAEGTLAAHPVGLFGDVVTEPGRARRTLETDYAQQRFESFLREGYLRVGFDIPSRRAVVAMSILGAMILELAVLADAANALAATGFIKGQP